MDLSSLDIFLAVAAERSITRASKMLGRAPSNVTTRIQQLEQDLGIALFSRDGKKMTPTREGELFLAYASRITALVLEAREAVKSAGSGILRVGTMESTAASRLPGLLTRFHVLWPAISLQLTMGATRDLARRVLANELDCALIARPPPRAGEENIGIDLSQLACERVFVEDLLIVLPAGHPAIETVADLHVDTLAALEPGCTYRAIAENWARKGRQLRTLELGSYHAILASVAAGHAIGVMPRSVLDLLHPPESVKTYPLGPVDTLLAWRRNDRSPSIDAFLKVLTDSRERPDDSVDMGA